ncbi:MAG: hypothetical protein RML12_07070 [Xanthomonadales bacterium]|nr:hypothetical protein [Xanthomonadales bacterium]
MPSSTALQDAMMARVGDEKALAVDQQRGGRVQHAAAGRSPGTRQPEGPKRR